ncbi:MAG: hypothetical protein ABL872_09755 [Lacibacter sp.]
MNNYSTHHKFHIPVMGLAYTIDSPIKVARFGISSVISIVEDRLVEMMRSHYYATLHLEYQPITVHEEDYRAKRITDYLNLVNTIVQEQVEKMKTTAFEKGSEIVKYFEMLPEDSTVKKMYRQMLSLTNQPEKEKIENYLRTQIVPGSIDVNIMTKIDRNNFNAEHEVIEDGSDAVTALRGFAKSNLSNSSVIFSAGMNPRLYNYLENCKELDINEEGAFAKKVVIKVSDYRSALIQGKYLAKKGIWVSEFRIESGLNCGGHAFATDGFLLGPILEEFKTNKQELSDELFVIYNAALQKKTGRTLEAAPEIIYSVQGGIGTHEEDEFLHQQYDIQSTGWGTPFLLVPEATTVDDDTMKLLCAAEEEDVELSHNSPLGVRFHYLKGTSADMEKAARISKGSPGSPCTEKLLAFNTEFTKEPICTASKKYQQLKIEQLQLLNLPEAEFNRQLNEVLDKDCLCVGLSNSAAINYEKTFVKKLNAVTICPGPNIVNFSKVVSLQTMTDHIYGRGDILAHKSRPHMFIAELYLYIDYLKEQLGEHPEAEQDAKKKKYISTFYTNLKNGIGYYQQLPGVASANRKEFVKALADVEQELDCLNYQFRINSN